MKTFVFLNRTGKLAIEAPERTLNMPLAEKLTDSV
jgi:hypothetical protein